MLADNVSFFYFFKVRMFKIAVALVRETVK